MAGIRNSKRPNGDAAKPPGTGNNAPNAAGPVGVTKTRKPRRTKLMVVLPVSALANQSQPINQAQPTRKGSRAKLMVVLPVTAPESQPNSAKSSQSTNHIRNRSLTAPVQANPGLFDLPDPELILRRARRLEAVRDPPGARAPRPRQLPVPRGLRTKTKKAAKAAPAATPAPVAQASQQPVPSSEHEGDAAAGEPAVEALAPESELVANGPHAPQNKLATEDLAVNEEAEREAAETEQAIRDAATAVDQASKEATAKKAETATREEAKRRHEAATRDRQATTLQKHKESHKKAEELQKATYMDRESVKRATAAWNRQTAEADLARLKAAEEKEAAEKLALQEEERKEAERVAEESTSDESALEETAEEKKAREKAFWDRIEAAAAESSARKAAAAEKLASEEAEKAAREKSALEEEARKKATLDRMRADAEKAAAEKAAAETLALEEAARKKKAEEEAARQRANAEKAAAEKAAAEKMALEEAARKTAAEEEAARQRANAEKAAAEKAAAEKLALEEEARKREAKEEAARQKAEQERAAEEKAQLEVARQKAAEEQAAAQVKAAQEKADEEKAAEKLRLDKEHSEQAAREEAARLEQAEKEAAEMKAAWDLIAEEEEAQVKAAAEKERARRVKATEDKAAYTTHFQREEAAADMEKQRLAKEKANKEKEELLAKEAAGFRRPGKRAAPRPEDALDGPNKKTKFKSDDSCTRLEDNLRQAKFSFNLKSDPPTRSTRAPGGPAMDGAHLDLDTIFQALASVTEAINLKLAGQDQQKLFSLFHPRSLVDHNILDHPVVLQRHAALVPIDRSAGRRTHFSLIALVQKSARNNDGTESDSFEMHHYDSIPSLRAAFHSTMTRTMTRTKILRTGWAGADKDEAESILSESQNAVVCDRPERHDWACGLHVILNGWACALGLKHNVDALLSKLGFYGTAIDLVNLAIRGVVSSQLILDFFDCYAYTAPDEQTAADRQSRTFKETKDFATFARLDTHIMKMLGRETRRDVDAMMEKPTLPPRDVTPSPSGGDSVPPSATDAYFRGVEGPTGLPVEEDDAVQDDEVPVDDKGYDSARSDDDDLDEELFEEEEIEVPKVEFDPFTGRQITAASKAAAAAAKAALQEKRLNEQQEKEREAAARHDSMDSLFDEDADLDELFEEDELYDKPSAPTSAPQGDAGEDFYGATPSLATQPQPILQPTSTEDDEDLYGASPPRNRNPPSTTSALAVPGPPPPTPHSPPANTNPFPLASLVFPKPPTTQPSVTLISPEGTTNRLTFPSAPPSQTRASNFNSAQAQPAVADPQDEILEDAWQAGFGDRAQDSDLEAAMAEYDDEPASGANPYNAAGYTQTVPYDLEPDYDGQHELGGRGVGDDDGEDYGDDAEYGDQEEYDVEFPEGIYE
jgi:hypothetical protein